jgi:uncharacterized protein (TIGR02996 family)
VSDEAALLRAIRAEPDEDTPRLAYADWLDEHGGAAGAARAEFIRLQIQIASRGGAGLTIAQAQRGKTPRGGRRLGKRTVALLAAHGLAWSLWDRYGPPYAVEEVVCGWEWHRGFLRHLSCAPDDWLRCVDDLLPRHPIRSVTFTGVPVVQRSGRTGPIWLWGRPWVDPPSGFLSADDELQLLLTHYWPGIRFETPSEPWEPQGS